MHGFSSITNSSCTQGQIFYQTENAQPVFSAEIFNTEVYNKTSIAVVELKTKKISTEQTKTGTGFYLYEVLKKVAYGQIIEVSDG